MKIAYSSRAVADIADYLSERNPQGARAVERRIREVLDHLAEFPGMGWNWRKGRKCVSCRLVDIPI